MWGNLKESEKINHFQEIFKIFEKTNQCKSKEPFKNFFLSIFTNLRYI